MKKEPLFPRILAVLTLLAIVSPLFAAGTSGRDESHEKAPPLPVPAAALHHPDQLFGRITARIQSGTATVQERRAWYQLRKMYYPFTADSMPPMNWRLEAARQDEGLSPGLAQRSTSLTSATAAGSYSWAHLGPTGYCVGDPPAAGCPDVGSGRGTAIWVNPNDKNQILAGFADGGVWKTKDQGLTWVPIFDFEPTMSVGSITAVIPPGGDIDSATIWVATGEGNFGGGQVEGVGVVKSTDGGTTWTTETIPWVVSSGGTSMAPDRTSIRRIAVDPNDSNKLWIAADSGVFRSIDGGTTWTLVTSLPYFAKLAGDCWYVYWTDLLIDDSTTPSTIYAANGRPFDAACSANARQDNGVYRSTDDGANWVNISQTTTSCPAGRGYSCVGSGFASLPGNVGRITLIHSAADKKKIYALLQDVSTYGSLGIWMTSDASGAAVTWTAESTTNYCSSQCWYDMAGAVSPTDSTHVIVGGLDAYISGNDAGTLNQTSSWTGWGTSSYVHADHHHAVWVDANTVYFVTDGGFYIGTVSGTGTNGVTWVGRNGGGLDTLQFYGIGQHPTTANQIHGGLQDNGEAQAVVNGSGTITGWNQAAGGDGGFSLTDQADGNYTYEEYVYAIVAQSSDGGATYGSCFRRFGGCTNPSNRCVGSCVPDSATEFIAPLEHDANSTDTNGRHILYSASKYVYRNNPAGSTTWVQYSPDLSAGSTSGDDIVHVHSAPNNGTAGVMWAGTTNGKVWKTTGATSDTQPAWTDVSAGLPNRSVTWITTHPTDGANQAIVTFSGFNTGHVWMTKDGGSSWTDISGALPNEPFNTVAVDPSDPTAVYVASDTGVYGFSGDPWTATTFAWTKINSGVLPNVKVPQLAFSAANGKLRAATHGRGFWEATAISCTTPGTPTITSVVANAPNSLTVSWNAGSPAGSTYDISRTDGACPGGSYSVVATGVTATSWTDNTVVSGNTYSYEVSAVDSTGGCQSALSSCGSGIAYGDCTTAPTFSGLSSATASASTTCAIDLSWSAATANCSGPVTYSVYRSTTSGFTPAASNRIATQISGTSYTDTSALAASTSYYYVARATDDSNNVEETNTVERSATTGAACTSAPLAVQAFTVTTTGDASGGQNLLEWWNPATGSPGTTVTINYRTDQYPTAPDDPAATTLVSNRAVTFGAVDTYTHTGLTNGMTYYYAIWVRY